MRYTPKLTILATAALVVIAAFAFGQGVPPVPPPKGYLFGDPKDSEAAVDLLSISFIVERPRGSVVWLTLMSGRRVKGLLMNVKTENDIVILSFPDAKKGEPGVECIKASAIASVAY